MKQQTFPVDDYPTQKKLWEHLETRIKLLNAGESVPIPQAVTMGELIDKYVTKQLSQLAKSTRDTDGSMLRVHFEPRWSDTLIADVHAEDVEDWVKSLIGVNGEPLGAASQARARKIMKLLIDRAMFWRFIPTAVNPIKLVKVKGASKRGKKIAMYTIGQVNTLIAALPHPCNVMVLTVASLGLRVEEVIPLQWDDFDFEARTVTIRRAFTHGELKEPKSDASWATLPLEGTLYDVLKAMPRGESEWLFPSPATGRCMAADTMLAKKIKPVAEQLGLPKAGWHMLRHSYKSWQGSSDAKPAELKDLMRHADISTTMDIYGGTPVETLRPYIAAISNQLRFPQ